MGNKSVGSQAGAEISGAWRWNMVELHPMSPLADAQTFATACAICALESTIVDTRYINKLTSINMSVPLHMVTFGTTSLNHWDLLCPQPGEALADGTLLGSSWPPSSLRDVTWSTPQLLDETMI